jgi:hypothetical protein
MIARIVERRRATSHRRGALEIVVTIASNHVLVIVSAVIRPYSAGEDKSRKAFRGKLMEVSRLGFLLAAVLACTAVAYAQEAPPPGARPNAAGGGGGGGRAAWRPVQTEKYHSTLVKLGGTAADALLFEPTQLNANGRVAILTSYDVPATELVTRGYRVLLVRHISAPGEMESPQDGFEESSRGITYLHSLPGVQHVVIAGWGGGAREVIFYADIAERGPSACRGPKVLYPCDTQKGTGLAKPDGVILFDPGLGSFTIASAVDPAYVGSSRARLDLDMYAAANGYDASTGSAKYSAEFRKRYFAAQSARNNQVIDDAEARLKALSKIKGATPADEPVFVPGAVNAGIATDLDRPDGSILAHTKLPHTLLKADGTRPQVIIESIRPPTGPIGDQVQKVLAQATRPARPDYTVRRFLANDAVRTTRDFAMTADDVIGVDWKSSNGTSPAQAEGITVPTLVMTNSCFQFVVTSEINYDHIAAKDKTFGGVEGSTHFFLPCKPEYGDTKGRLFDYVDEWLAKPGRF